MQLCCCVQERRGQWRDDGGGQTSPAATGTSSSKTHSGLTFITWISQRERCGSFNGARLWLELIWVQFNRRKEQNVSCCFILTTQSLATLENTTSSVTAVCDSLLNISTFYLKHSLSGQTVLNSCLATLTNIR